MNNSEKSKLLIVDDEKMNLKVLTNILISEYTIFTATNGKEAIQRAVEYKPDLILLDILMPEMDGYQTLLEIKKNEQIKKTPVVFITGLNSDEDEEKGLSLDAADYITKPFSAMIVKIRVRNQIQIVNQLKMIEHLNLTDQLTELPNKQYFDERINMEWKQAIREKTQISLLLIDVDRFKSINDIYGHQHGDTVLKIIAGILKDSLKRPGDITARWGGGEFIILMPNTSDDGALEVAEKIRSDIEKKDIRLENKNKINITVSIGVNSHTPARTCLVQAFITNTDKALYAAKEAGRNKVIPFKEAL
ncbi:MAG: diguanylate cyclase [Treponema sp.]|nr:diguanylate cyclase [Treponema sp.]MCL2271893.1 diguanylate cyclase [Treponema sp.]